MNNAKTIAAFCCIAMVAAFLLFQPSIIGFFALPPGSNEKTNAMDSSNEPESNQNVELKLDYEVLLPSKMDTNTLIIKIPNCPDETAPAIIIKNLGSKIAGVKVLFPSSIKIISCSNCYFDELNAGEEKVIAFRACKIAAAEKNLRIISANSNELAIKME